MFNIGDIVELRHTITLADGTTYLEGSRGRITFRYLHFSLGVGIYTTLLENGKEGKFHADALKLSSKSFIEPLPQFDPSPLHEWLEEL